MFRETSPQLSLFDPCVMFPGVLPPDDWCYIYRDKIYPLIDENQFKHLYDEDWGAPNKSIKLQVSLLIFMNTERLTWRETADFLQRRIDWMIAAKTPFDMARIDHSTLHKFYDRISNDEVVYDLFMKLTGQFILECRVSGRQQRTDSYFMDGWLAKLSRYGLLKETNRVFLQNLRKQKPGLYDSIRKELSRDYLKDAFDLTEKDKELVSKKIKDLAQDMYQLKAAFENHHQIKHYQTFQTLVRIFGQQCDIKSHENDPKSEKAIDVGLKKSPDGSGEKIVSTPHNPDAQYTRKRDRTVTGHKAFVTETCDPENDVQFLTDVNLEAAGHSDAEEIHKIHERLEKNGHKPEDHYCDAGFVNGESILESAKRGINLEGPSAGRSQSFEQYRDEERPLDAADFEVWIEDENKELIVLACPSGNKPLDQVRSKKTGRSLVHFDNRKCDECPIKNRCPVKIGVRVSTLDVSEAQYAGAERHHKYMEDAEYRKKCGIRSGAESLVNEVANKHGTRRSRHRTEKRSKMQLLFAAIACNVKRYINNAVDSCTQNQPKMVENTI